MYEDNTIRHLNRVANRFKNAIQISMKKTPKTGFVRDDGHITSSAPNPPAVDSGILWGSIKVNPAGKTRKFSSVSTDIDYGARLQLIYQRNFMGKNSPARNDALAFANRIGKDIKIRKTKVR